MNDKPLTKKEVIYLLKNLKTNHLETEFINLFDAENRFLADSITSSINLPPFNNSAVDGYALHDEDVAKNNIFKVNDNIYEKNRALNNDKNLANYDT